jgi:hypothetical protein
MELLLHARLTGTGTNTDGAYLPIKGRYEVKSAQVVDLAGVAANGSNYAEIKVLGNDQSTALFQWSTKTGEEGALTQYAQAELADQEATEKAILEDEPLVVQLAKAGTGVNVDCYVCVRLVKARSY